MNAAFSRRQFFNSLIPPSTLAWAGVWVGCASPGSRQNPQRARSHTRSSFFRTRGVVLVPEDLTLRDWPQRAHAAGLNAIGLHHGVSPQEVVRFIRSENGVQFLQQCHRLGLEIEYELHAVRELLPRPLFSAYPEFFRSNERGERSPDANLCVHSSRALDIAAENAVALAHVLRPTTHRYFYWGDDAKSWCHCPNCRGLSESDQALILENHLVAALQRMDSRAQLAHLAYSNTLWPPRQIRPAPGIFLEYAPINRRYDIPYAQQIGSDAADSLDALDANLQVFDRSTARVLEYWLDVSRFSRWKKPAVKLPWNDRVFAADLDAYGARGIRHITTFAVFIDADYVSRYGEPVEIVSYGKQLSTWKRR